MFEEQSQQHIPEVAEAEKENKVPEAELQRKIANQWADEYSRYLQDRSTYKAQADSPEKKEHASIFAELARNEIIPEEIRQHGERQAAVEIELDRYEKSLESRSKVELMKECAGQWLQEMWHYTEWALFSKEKSVKVNEPKFRHPFGVLTHSKEEQNILWEIRIARDKYRIAMMKLKTKDITE